jgi:hypothetical protein
MSKVAKAINQQEKSKLFTHEHMKYSRIDSTTIEYVRRLNKNYDNVRYLD